MEGKKIAVVLFGSIFLLLAGGTILLQAADTDDGISEYTDEPIAGDDTMGSKDTNINFIVIDAIGKAKMKRKQASDGQKDPNDQSNYNDGSGDSNTNSIVLEPGSKVDKVYNIVIEK
jgi:hypothetical protein